MTAREPACVERVQHRVVYAPRLSASNIEVSVPRDERSSSAPDGVVRGLDDGLAGVVNLCMARSSAATEYKPEGKSKN